tara:strand:- start:222 stop:446 length:225 start_codon:yes stop_codon:yes gene_type:complete
MEAYNIKYGTKVVVKNDDVVVPPGALPVYKGDEIVIGRLDGMYCNGKNSDGEIIYIAAWTDVEICTTETLKSAQ